MKHADPAILIATSSLDMPNVQPVTDKLAEWGHAPLIYEADLVAAGEKYLAIHVGHVGLEAVYDGHDISDRGVSAAWLRRPEEMGPIVPGEDIAYRLWLDRERYVSQNAVWEDISKSKWLNSPAAMNAANNKLTQLALAQSIGFTIPETVVSNSRATIASMIQEDRIIKMHRGVIPTKDGYKGHYTAPIPYDPDKLPEGFPFPGLWQRNIPKAREWRITVVGNQVFDAAIYTSGPAKADWRQYQNDPELVQFKAESFPDEQKAMCLEMLRECGLQYGTFDFIEEPDSEIIFGELNTNGQYGWLEDKLGLPISDAIASSLVEISKQHS